MRMSCLVVVSRKTTASPYLALSVLCKYAWPHEFNLKMYDHVDVISSNKIDIDSPSYLLCLFLFEWLQCKLLLFTQHHHIYHCVLALCIDWHILSA